MTLKKRALIITGNEICHNFFSNSLAQSCPDFDFDTLKYYSGKTDFEYYFPIYSVGLTSAEEKNSVTRFIYSRNLTFALREDPELLYSPKSSRTTSTEAEFTSVLDKLVDQYSYDFVFTYGAPIIRNVKLLKRTSSYNIHLGLSRFYRGGKTNIVALSKGEYEKVGATCHELREEIDTGSVLFEVTLSDYSEIKTIDQLTYYLIREVTHKISVYLNGTPINKFSITPGKMFYHKQFHGQMVIEAENNLRTWKN